MKNIDTDGK